jgi:hypothetical protein
MATEFLPDGDAKYSVRQYPGIAFHYMADETEPDEDTEWTGYEVPTGNVIMVMVGDDHRFSIDPDDCTILADGESCPACGRSAAPLTQHS